LIFENSKVWGDPIFEKIVTTDEGYVDSARGSLTVNISKNLIKAARNNLDAYSQEVDAGTGKTVNLKEATYLTSQATAYKTEIQVISDQLPFKLNHG